MMKRRWKWFGKLESGENFTLAYGNRSITYKDERGAFEFGFEDGLLSSPPTQTSGSPVSLSEETLNLMVERVIKGIESEGHSVRLVQR